MSCTDSKTWFLLAFLLSAAGSLTTSVLGQEKTDRHGDPLPKGAFARLGTTRFRPILQISALAVSPDGKTLVSASYQGITTWDLATGKQKSVFADDLDYCSLALADAGKTLITVNERGILRYRESTTGEIVHEFALTKDPEHWEYYACSMTRNGRYLAFPDATTETVCVWDLTARKELARIASQTYPISISEDGRLLARGRGSPLEVWDIPNARLVKSFEHTDPCYMGNLGFSPDGKTLMSLGSHSHGTRSWDIESGKLRTAYGRAPRETRKFAFSDDGKKVATLHEDEKGFGLCVWDFAAGKQLWRHTMVPFSGQALVFTPDGNTLITAGRGSDAIIRLWDVLKGTEIRTFPGADGAPARLVSSPDGRWLTASNYADRILLWDVKSQAQVAKFSDASYYGIAAFSPDSKQVAYGHQDGSVRLCEAGNGKETLRFEKLTTDARDHYGNGKDVTALAFSPDGQTLLTSHVDLSLVTRNVSDTNTRRTIALTKELIDEEHGRSMQFHYFSRDASVLLTKFRVEKEPYLIWNTETGQRRGEPAKNGGYDHVSYSLSPDGQSLASTLHGTSIRIYDTKTGAEQCMLLNPERGKDGFNGPLAYSSDGRLLAAGREYGGSTVDLWDVNSGQHLQRFDTMQGGVSGITFVGKDDLLAIGGRDTTILLWDIREVRRDRP